MIAVDTVFCDVADCMSCAELSSKEDVKDIPSMEAAIVKIGWTVHRSDGGNVHYCQTHRDFKSEKGKT
jgi:hypothetical protein